VSRLALVAAALGALLLAFARSIQSAFDLVTRDVPEQIGLVLIFAAFLYFAYRFLTDDGTW